MEFVLGISHRNRERAKQRAATMKLNREIRDISNPFNSPDFHKIYRFPVEVALRLLEDLKPFYPPSSNVNAIPVELKFLAALHFLAQGSYQKSCGKDAGCIQSQSSMSRAISQTVLALNEPEILRKWIKFPTTQQNRNNIIAKNYRKYQIPGVVGYVDGTHINITPPGDHEELYVNRKSVHSINVQMVCDSDLQILNVCAQYPGSTHDSFIWKSSKVRQAMMAAYNECPCWLLGDSGYPIEPWLVTPILHAEEESPEERFTQLHIKARNCVERCFGVLKGHWRCINKTRTLNYAPKKVGYIVNACAVLHNIGVWENIGDPETFDDEDPQPEEDTQSQVNAQPEPQAATLYNEGILVRAEIVRRLS